MLRRAVDAHRDWLRGGDARRGDRGRSAATRSRSGKATSEVPDAGWEYSGSRRAQRVSRRRIYTVMLGTAAVVAALDHITKWLVGSRLANGRADLAERHRVHRPRREQRRRVQRAAAAALALSRGGAVVSLYIVFCGVPVRHDVVPAGAHRDDPRWRALQRRRPAGAGLRGRLHRLPLLAGVQRRGQLHRRRDRGAARAQLRAVRTATSSTSSAPS